jgi:hypothetical protein
VKPAKFAENIIAQEFDGSEVVDADGNGMTIAMVRMFRTGQVGLMWSPVLFNDMLPLPDELREQLVKMLRFHADRLEDHSLDERMKQVAGKMAGEA